MPDPRSQLALMRDGLKFVAGMNLVMMACILVLPFWLELAPLWLWLGRELLFQPGEKGAGGFYI